MRSISLFFAFLLMVIQSFCSTIYTRCNGNWNDPNIWQGGVVPSTGDSIYVNHSVRLTSDLVLNNNYLNVAYNADICGCYSLITNAGCNIVINGIVKFNSVINYGNIIVNGTIMTNSVDNHGDIMVYGLVMAGWNCYCSPVTNNCDPPIAAFSASDTSICEGDCINFSDSSLHNPTSWNWQFYGSNTPASNSQNPQNICYPSQGSYDVRLIVSNPQGSDTLIRHHYIKVKGRSASTISPVVCQSYLSPDGQHVYSSTGTYQDTLINANGCDSIITIHLTILNSYTTINDSACQEYFSPSGNYVWYNSGTYTDTVSNAAGCDSIISINLTILHTASVIHKTSCHNYVSPSGNNNWTQSGIYSDTIPNTAGCDSVITINLIIGENNTSVIDISVCDRYASPSHHYLWTSSGIYFDTIPTVAGCDSIISIDLTIESCESYLYVPNIFSPNGDGQNDILYVRGKHIEEIAFYIYDRWGEKIFESNDINNGWDGSYKAKPLNEGVFTYYLKVKLNNGDEQFKKGNITLVR